MDIQMPFIDGLVATGMIRKKEEATGRHQQVIALTAHAFRVIGNGVKQWEWTVT
jgi:CheY-like chemotaxis protein